MPGHDYCARCRGSDCICELIVEVRRLDREASSATMQLQEDRGLRNARANRLSELDKERAELTPVLDRVKALLKKVNAGVCTSQTNCAGYSLKCVSCGSSDLLGRLARLRPDPARKSGMEPEENSEPPILPSPTNTAPRVKVSEIMLFANGNTAVISGNEQVPRLQGSWVGPVVARLRRLGADFDEATMVRCMWVDGPQWPAAKIYPDHCDCGGRIVVDDQIAGAWKCASCDRRTPS